MQERVLGVCHPSGFAGVGLTSNTFISRAKAGDRPIWLAAGAAWTGLDLSDKSAAEPCDDLILTDLVIPAVPFGLERSTTHHARVQRIGFMAEIINTQRKLRQGLGRLVRRDGLQHRRIWLLDGRMINPATNRFVDLRRVLTPYLKRKSFG